MTPETATTQSQNVVFRRRPNPVPTPTQRVWTANVLLIDDDVADTCLILDVLRRHPSVSAARATDAPEFALRQLEAGRLKPDVVLLDVQMPRMNGFRFLEGMREISSLDHVPVVFLTTSSAARDVKEAERSSASMYIIKPDTYFELQARLSGVIRRVVNSSWSN